MPQFGVNFLFLSILFHFTFANGPVLNYSSHHCIGAQHHLILDKKIICIFHNVCIHPQHPGLIQYFEDPSIPERSPKFYSNGTWYDNFPLFLWCRRLRNLVVVSKRNLPSRVNWVTPDVVALACPVYCGYWSHNWLDNIFPYFHAARSLNVWNESNFGIFWSASEIRIPRTCAKCKHSIPRFSSCACRPFFKEWIWKSGIVDPTSKCNVEYNEPTCFKSLIVGGSIFGMDYREASFSGLAPSLWAMRRIVRWNIASLTDSDGPVRQKVLLVKKDKKRGIYNLLSLRDHLTQCFPDVVFTVASFAVLSPREQIRLLNQMTVMISPSGSVGFTAMFGPNPLVTIFMDRYKPSSHFTWGADQYVFMQMPWLHVMQYPVSSSSLMIFQSGGKFHIKDPDKLYHAYGAVVANATLMSKFLYWALRSARDLRGDTYSEFQFNDTNFLSGRC